MSRKAKSVKGEEVDFDLLQVKSNIQNTNKPLDVKTREDFVHLKRRRRGNSKVSEMLAFKAEELQKLKDSEISKQREDITVHTKPNLPEDTSPVVEQVSQEKKRQIVKKDNREDAVDE